MITALRLLNVGPADSWDLRFKPGINVLAGDNGLGKTFVLEAIWAVLTTRMGGVSGFRRQPGRDPAVSEIGALFQHREGPKIEFAPQATWSFDRPKQEWVRGWYLGRHTAGFKVKEEKTDEAEWRPQSLVVYVKADGAVAVWDSYAARSKIENFPAAATELTAAQVWQGKWEGDDRTERRQICAGFLDDVGRWQGEKAPEFAALADALGQLSESGQPLAFDTPALVRLDDRRDIPTLRLPYGVVPVTLASAGMKRILGLAYTLIWAWREHRRVATVLGLPPTRDIVLMVDEVEAHLHPLWQRTVLPSLGKAVARLAPEAGVQSFITTHAPLVLASLEPTFHPASDALFTFDLAKSGKPREVKVEQAAWRRMGDANAWLTSEVFDLPSPRSVEAEGALRDAIKAIRDPRGNTPDQLREIDARLRGVLGETEPFWARWAALLDATGAGQ